MAEIKIAFINESTDVSDADVANLVPALQKQVRGDFAPAWGVDADLRFVPRGENPKPGEWWVVILDNADQAGVLSYHDVTMEGLPLGKVFPLGRDCSNATVATVGEDDEGVVPEESRNGRLIIA